jgi:hypothetical protein
MTYQMIAAGEIETVRVGKRQLVVTESYLRLIDERRAAGPGTMQPAKPAASTKIARASDQPGAA